MNSVRNMQPCVHPDGKKLRLTKAIGDSIRHHALIRNETLARAAEVAGVSASVMSRICRGEMAPTVHVLAALAEHYDVLIDELVPIQVDGLEE
jgi:transcriptional regulator with XRE-family HTH domain